MAAAATSVLSLCGSPALADSNADGATSNSPGVLSGNTVQAPINVPVNVCGNTVDVLALLNPAFGNSCDVQSNPAKQVTPDIPRQAGSGDTGSSQTPRVPGQTPSPVIATHTPEVGRTPAPVSPAHTPEVGRTPAPQSPAPTRGQQSGAPAVQSQRDVTPQALKAEPAAVVGARPSLAHTGSEAMLASSAVSAVMIAGGLILYRRGRVAGRR